MKIKIFFLLIFAVYKTVCEIDPCNHYTCGECIGNPNCVWCAANKIDGTEKKCMAISALQGLKVSKNWCNGVIENPKLENKVTINKSFDEKINGVQVQFRPQEIKIKVRPGVPVPIQMSYRPAKDYPLDIYFLMDIAYSIKFQGNALQAQAKEILDHLKEYTNNVRLGIGSFIEKPGYPHVDKAHMSTAFKNHLQLTDNMTAFVDTVEHVQFGANFDDPEAGLEALMQVMKCEEQLGWRPGARRIIVLCTDSTYHSAGDDKVLGDIRPNDMQCHVENDLYNETMSLTYDYPSVSQINTVATQGNFIIIFAAKKAVHTEYTLLAKNILGARYANLDEKQDAVEKIKTAYRESAQSMKLAYDLPPYIKLSLDQNCKTKPTRNCESTAEQKTVSVDANLTVLYCPPDEVLTQNLEIKLESVNHKLTIKMEIDCKCDCEKVPGKKDNRCSGAGAFQCGICKCDPGSYGIDCHCNGTSTDTEDIEKCKLLGDEKLCSGRGTCRCGKCETCLEGYSGDFCQFDDKACPRMCNNNGICTLGKCHCDAGWAGDDCSCLLNTDACIAPYSKEVGDEKLCSGRGTCRCGKCETCLEGYSGDFCQFDDKACPRMCNNNGICTLGKCYCGAGWAGDDCSCLLKTDGCIAPYSKEVGDEKLCNGRGTCRCGKCETCLEGYSGDFCQFDDKACPRMCNNNGICTLGKCHCDAGWAGDDCSCLLKTDGCIAPYSKEVGDVKLCSGRGTCRCGKCETCLEGYSGDFCQFDDKACPRMCNNNGICTLGKCHCDAGWAGDDCSCLLKTDGCIAPYSKEVGDEKLCSGRGTCRCGTCETCLEGYSGDFCQFDDKACPRMCNNNGICTLGKCHCDAGWAGDDCSCLLKTDGCIAPYPKEVGVEKLCSGRGTCRCGKCETCLEGYSGDFCQFDDKACPRMCNNNGICTLGKCHCDAGWAGDDCSCLLKTDGCIAPYSKEVGDEKLCSGRGTCRCGTCETCLEGYSGDFCQFDDKACPRMCNNNGICTLGKCHCDAGWAGDDCTCLLKTDGCIAPYSKEVGDEKLCSGRGTCRCGKCETCLEGYSGEFCQFDDKACPRMCNSNGICTLGKCHCDAGWAGDDCSCLLKTDGCIAPYSKEVGDEKLCSGRGTCRCGKCETCLEGYSGDFCQFDDKACPRMCNNNGICTLGKCHCDAGWAGDDCICLLKTDGCIAPYSKEVGDEKLCSGRGTCRCGKCETCLEGYSGDFCQFDDKACPRMCNNNGICNLGKCHCDAGWAADDCSCLLKTDGCIAPYSKEVGDEKLCSGRGTCRCGKCETCLEGYSGDFCQFDDKACPRMCNNNGICTLGKCHCDAGWAGDDCTCLLNTDGCIEPYSKEVGDEKLCSGRGTCRCGKCETCLEGYSGDFCQFNDKACPRICNNNGICTLGKCHCGAGWAGDDCSCLLKTDGCIAPYSKEICSGNGNCICGSCVCNKLKGNNATYYSGRYCDDCDTCAEKRCKDFEKYVICNVMKAKPACDTEFNVTSTILVEFVNKTVLEGPEWHMGKWCKTPLENNSYIIFKFQYNDLDLKLGIQNEADLPAKAYIFVAVASGIGISLLLIVILILIVLKILFGRHDKREYEKFAK